MSHPLKNQLITVDCHYRTPLRSCSFLMIESGRASFVDNNTMFAVPYLLQALKEQNISTENVDYLIVTHAHLDHAGGTSALLKRCPNAKVIAHPKAARNLVHPERLIESARSVYGETQFAELFGNIEPTPEDRIQTVTDNETITWGGRTLQFLYTLGHSTHHICIHDSKTNGVFTGDAFGVGLSDQETFETKFIVSSTAPPDFDAVESEKTVRRILSLNPDYVFLPHYGIHKNPQQAASYLLRSLSAMDILIQTALDKNIPDEELMNWLFPRLIESIREQVQWCGVQDIDSAMNWLGDNLEINTMGLMVAVQRKRNNKK